jgi:DNA-binding transcriptional regulator YhcF (GntR family)
MVEGVIILRIDFDSIKPIYIQVAEAIEDDIIAGKLAEKGPVYSQLILSKELGINPATAAKGINVLVQKGILEKQRGMSMVVAAGARDLLLADKQENGLHSFIAALVEEAQKIEVPEDKLIRMIKSRYANVGSVGKSESIKSQSQSVESQSQGQSIESQSQSIESQERGMEHE